MAGSLASATSAAVVLGAATVALAVVVILYSQGVIKGKCDDTKAHSAPSALSPSATKKSAFY